MRATSKRTVALSLLVTLLSGVLVVGAATVAVAHFDDSRVSLGVSDRTVRPNQRITFFGRLRNEHRNCRRGELVQLIRRGSGVVETDRTDRQGEFSFRHNPQPNRGRFFARYNGKGRFGYNNRHRCGADSSRTIRIRRQ
jgi:hypothetical protein